jgi:hypothetical protein
MEIGKRILTGGHMNKKKEQFIGMGKRTLQGAALALLMASGGLDRLQAQSASRKEDTERQALTTPGKFYCNIKALNSAERAHHKRLTAKLIAVRKDIVETEKGYEFQFTPESISLAELADWAAAEGKCCPFFDFHIDLEHAGRLLCLRLTGEEGVKAFIRLEFQVPG